QTGKPAGHQWAVLMATSGKKHWPPMGRTQWPLTLLQPVARGAVSLTVTAAGFAVLFLPSLWTGPM
ncbi:MAG: hypothetical protein DI613_20655, partial [Kocuria rhizophila]